MEKKHSNNTNDNYPLEYAVYSVFSNLFDQHRCMNSTREVLRKIYYADLSEEKQDNLQRRVTKLLEEDLMDEVFGIECLGRKVEILFHERKKPYDNQMVFDTYGWRYVISTYHTRGGIVIDIRVYDLINAATAPYFITLREHRRPVYGELRVA